MQRQFELCENGKRCLTHEEAARVVKSLRRSTGDIVHLYKCPEWRSHPKFMYHVGHNLPTRRAVMKTEPEEF